MKEYKTEKDKRKFYRSKDWERLRREALARDNNECQECKRQGKVIVDSVKVEGERKKVKLNVHHKKEIEYHPELALELENLETVCLRCHNNIHDKLFILSRAKQWDDERW